jgi:glycosyltransferase involved in cell wall biosynthesis
VLQRARGDQRRRVLAVIASSSLGGAEQVLLSLLQGIDRDRFAVWVACHGDGPMLEAYRRHAAGVWTLDLLDVFDARTVARLARLMARLRCDVVHTHLWTADVLGGLAAARARVPARVATVHGEYFRAADVAGIRRVRRRALSAGYRAVYRLFPRVIAVADSVRRDLVTRPGLRVRPDQVVVIHNGVGPLPALPAPPSGEDAARGTPPRAPTVLVAANFYPIKGHRDLVEAMPRVLQRCPNVQFVLAGDGPTLPAIRRAVEARGLGASVRFAGAVPDARGLLAQSDALVVPSRSEGLPLAVLEALALGKPVVATRVGGIPEIVTDGATGLLVPPEDPGAMAEALVRLLAEPALARALGAAGREVAGTRFAAAAMVRRTERVYLELAGGRRPARG